MILPGARLSTLLIAGAAAFALGVVVPAAFYAGIWLDAALAAALIADAACLPRRRAMEIARAAPARAVRGRPLALETTIRRRGGAAAVAVELREEPPVSFDALETPAPAPVPAGGTRVFLSRWIPTIRGRFPLGEIHVRVRSPLRLFVRQWKVGFDGAIDVDPEPREVERGIRTIRAWLQTQGTRPVRVHGRASEFEQLRDHVEGDEFRAVDWKATARRGVLTVREYRTERNREVSILLDVGRRMSARFLGESKCDAALEAALGLVRVALEAGDRVGFLAFSAAPVLDVPSRRGKPHFQAIFDATRHVEPRAEESSLLAALRHHRARHRRRSFFLVLTDLSDPITARRAAPALAAAARRHHLFFVAVDDPQRRALEDRPVATSEDAYLLAGARRLHRERLQVLAELRGAGIRCADLLPNEIASAALDHYLAAAMAEEF